MISKNYMLTAAHCLYNIKQGSAAKSIKAYFGRNGKSYSYVYNSSKLYFQSTVPSGVTLENDWGVI